MGVEVTSLKSPLHRVGAILPCLALLYFPFSDLTPCAPWFQDAEFMESECEQQAILLSTEPSTGEQLDELAAPGYESMDEVIAFLIWR